MIGRSDARDVSTGSTLELQAVHLLEVTRGVSNP